MNDTELWVWLSEALCKGSRKSASLLSRFADISKIYSAERDDFLSLGIKLTEKELSALTSKSLEPARKILSDCERLGIRIITQASSEYPARLLEIPDAPTLLYAKGKPLSVDSAPAIAVVGTRRASLYGQSVAKKLAREITELSGIIVSGMARGIDSVAMDSALSCGGYVIGVLGCGLDICYPRENKSLMKRIEQNGTLLSEFPPKTEPNRINFPKRNRILSALSLGIVVVEAPEKSGALITARIGLEQNKDVFAVPSGIFDDSSTGSNALIRAGATPVMSGHDVMAEYAHLFPDISTRRLSPQTSEDEPPKTSADSPSPLSSAFLSSHSHDEQTILLTLENKECRADEIASSSKMPLPKVLSLLTLLEIRGSVKQLPGNVFKITNN